MASVDDLFRKPNAVPKRKLEDPTTTFGRQPSKSAKLSNGTSPRSRGNPLPPPINGSSSKSASVEDEIPDDPDLEAGPTLHPEDIEDEPDDDEGRFFGGGVTQKEREVLDYIDKNEDETDEKIDAGWLRRAAITFERKINKNAELRAKHEKDPLKFVGSEADLDTEIKGLSLLAEHGELYTDFVKMNSAASLVSLLAHENTDIAIAVCELLAELTDEDAVASESQWKVLVDAFLEADVLSLLSSNLNRLDEATEADRTGIYHVLSVLENLLSQPSLLPAIAAVFLPWLTSRTQTPDPVARGRVSQNRQYAAELLAIILQGNLAARRFFAGRETNGIDVLLQLLSSYRKRDPEKDSDEAEFVENCFDCLTCVVEEAGPAQTFIDGEGVELCLIMLREGHMVKGRALKVLDHAMGGAAAAAVCEKVVEAVGLKTLFGMVMKTGKKKVEREGLEHLIGMLASLLRYIPAGTAGRIRVLAKFVEGEYEKISRLVEVRGDYKGRVLRVEGEIEREKSQVNGEEAGEMEDEWLSRRLDAGLFALQTLDVILSWLVAEDDGARAKIGQLLKDEGGLDVLAKSLTTQIDGMDADAAGDADSAKEMLEALLRCLV